MAKWGTVSPPKKNGRYLVTIDTSFGRQVRQADRAESPIGNWYWQVVGDAGSSSGVVAWQKCPQPYKEAK